MTDKYMNFLSLELTEAVAGTMISGEIDTGVDQASLMAMEIHEVEIKIGYNDSQAGAGIYQQSKAALATISTYATTPPDFSDEFVLHEVERAVHGDAAGTDFTIEINGPFLRKFNPPLLIAAKNLTLYMKGRGTDVESARCRVGFTFKKLGLSEWTELWQTWNQ